MTEPILGTQQLQAFYVLEVHGIQKIAKAVNDIDLEIREDEVYGIAGESGCGKTTLLKTLFGAIEPPLRLIGGKIFYRVDGEWLDVTVLKQEERRKLRMQYISYVPQGSMRQPKKPEVIGKRLSERLQAPRRSWPNSRRKRPNRSKPRRKPWPQK